MIVFKKIVRNFDNLYLIHTNFQCFVHEMDFKWTVGPEKKRSQDVATVLSLSTEYIHNK